MPAQYASAGAGDSCANRVSHGCPPANLCHHLGFVTKRRDASGLKRLYKYFTPDMANLAGGLPHLSYFPFDTLEAAVARPERFARESLSASASASAAAAAAGPVSPFASGPGSRSAPSSASIAVPKESTATTPEEKIDIATALQYGTAQGYPPLYAFVRRFVREHLHPNVPYAGGPEVLLSCGSTDGFAKVLEAFVNNWDPDRHSVSERQGMLVEEFAYPSPVQLAKPKGLNIVPVSMDAEGMLPASLKAVLERWDFGKGRRPHLMYTVTMGQNPTGGTLSLKRRKQIYAICQAYDVLIVEDDPYWCLQYPSAYKLAAEHRSDRLGPSIPSTPASSCPARDWKSSGYDFLDSLAPSYLSVDVDGRVIRLDTFSKTIAPGCRLGWITAQPVFIERLTRIAELSTQQPSGFVQALVAELFLGQGGGSSSSSSSSSSTDKKKNASEINWQMDGWVRWLGGLRDSYEQRMQRMCGVLEEGKFYIDDTSSSSSSSSSTQQEWQVVAKTKMYDFAYPTAGMFVWLRLYLESHPLHRARPAEYPLQRLSRALWLHLTMKPHRCLVAPGESFATSGPAACGWRYHRVCFAPMHPDDVLAFTRRLVQGYASFWSRTDLDGLEDEDEDEHGDGDGRPASMPMAQFAAAMKSMGLGC